MWLAAYLYFKKSGQLVRIYSLIPTTSLFLLHSLMLRDAYSWCWKRRRAFAFLHYATRSNIERGASVFEWRQGHDFGAEKGSKNPPAIPQCHAHRIMCTYRDANLARTFREGNSVMAVKRHGTARDDEEHAHFYISFETERKLFTLLKMRTLQDVLPQIKHAGMIDKRACRIPSAGNDVLPYLTYLMFKRPYFWSLNTSCMMKVKVRRV